MANYIPLLALPPVMSAVLGTRRITVLTVILSSVLMGLASWQGYPRARAGQPDLPRYAMLALYTDPVPDRLGAAPGVTPLQPATDPVRTGHKLLRLQGRIQDMVVQSVRDGVLVVGNTGRLRAINQAAQNMLHISGRTSPPGLPIAAIAEMAPLQHLIRQSF